MRVEIAQQADNSWSRKLGSLAISATGAYPELRAGHTDAYSPFQTHDHYYRAIQSVLDASHHRHMPVRSRLSDWVTKRKSFQDVSTKAFTILASSHGADAYRQAKGYYDSVESIHMTRFTEVIDEMAQDERDPHIKSDIEQISAGITRDDTKLKLKITLDGLRTTLQNTNLHKYTKRLVFGHITDAMIPELQIQDPNIVTSELLLDLQNYGLMEYVNLGKYFAVPFGTEQAGNNYHMRMEFMGRPDRDEISDVPFAQRMATYEREQREYKTQRSQVADQLNILEEHQNPQRQGHFTGYNDEWIGNNLETVGQVLSSVLTHDITARIIQSGGQDQTTGFSAVDVFMRSPRVSPRQLDGLRTAIAAMYAHTVDFPTQDNIGHLSSALNSFRNLTMKLYDLERK